MGCKENRITLRAKQVTQLNKAAGFKRARNGVDYEVCVFYLKDSDSESFKTTVPLCY